jgi:hypothetical protein
MLDMPSPMQALAQALAQVLAKVSVGINNAIAAEHVSYQKIAGRWRIASKSHREI